MSTGSPDRGLYDVRWQPIAQKTFAEKPKEPASCSQSLLANVAFFACLFGVRFLSDSYRNLQEVLQDGRAARYFDTSHEFKNALLGICLLVVGQRNLRPPDRALSLEDEVAKAHGTRGTPRCARHSLMLAAWSFIARHPHPHDSAGLFS